ncbi:MAG: hypothetical protein BWY79_01350 [Actinobacteria bacterium ADurb.Bin444]|nr:MAG: hypothetical protein BWY79_01350 [Actinobacteria bacterium ADurb.Bin444]
MSNSTSARRATIFMSRLTPVVMVMRDAWRGLAAWNSSLRLMSIFTGRRLLRAKSAANGSNPISSLPPKPPPMCMPITRILVMGQPNAWDM